MSFYFNKRELEGREIEALLTSWPTTDIEGTTPAIHSELKASCDYTAAKDAVEAALTPSLISAGVSVEEDALAPSWVVVTFPQDVQVDGVWETFWSDLANHFEQSHTAKLVGLVEPVLAKEDDGVTPIVPITVESYEGVWKVRDRCDRWLGLTGYIGEIILSVESK